MQRDLPWQSILPNMTIIPLSAGAKLLVPSLFFSSASKATRGVSFEGGKFGFLLGLLVTAGSIALGWVLTPAAGTAGIALAFWLLGTTGVVMMANGVRPLAFVKPICISCRLFPVIKEHEAIHLSGVRGETEVWASMKTRYSVEGLKLEGDPAICWFCPIPKRLKEH